jgi:hypothetical protein
MKINVPVEKPRSATEEKARAGSSRIQAGWLGLLRAILPLAGRGREKSAARKRPDGGLNGSVAAKPGGPGAEGRRPAALDLLSRVLLVGLGALPLLCGCAGPRPLKGGKAITIGKPAGMIEQTLAQGENASQPSRQAQETVKVRTYTLPAASRVEQPQTPATAAPRSGAKAGEAGAGPAFVLSAPMPVIEREETRAQTELGAAQKDTGRELAARLSSLKGIVWVGVGLFVFGLASLVYPPLRVAVASVTTSAALMLGGVALMVLPTMVVGHELLIAGGVGLAVGAWFLAHRHGQLRGAVEAGAGRAASSNPETVTGSQ